MTGEARRRKQPKKRRETGLFDPNAFDKFAVVSEQPKGGSDADDDDDDDWD